MADYTMRVVMEWGSIKENRDPALVVEIEAKVKGVAARRQFERFEQELRGSEFGPHVERVEANTSRCRLYLRPSLAFMRAFLAARARLKDEAAGQRSLFEAMGFC